MKKAVFLVYNQAYYMEFVEILKDKFGHSGYTLWSDVSGRGTNGGEPHEGSHAWPTMNNALMTIVDEEQVAPILDVVRELDKTAPGLGVRAFVWNIDRMY